MSNPLAYFQKIDPVLYEAMKVIGEIPPVTKRRSKVDHFTELCASIVSQQLSTKVADIIWARVLHLLPDQQVTPESILSTDTESFRKVGISYAKIRYIKDLAQKVRDQVIDLEKLDDLSDEEIISELIKVKGIGRWTAEMFLMFSLDRPDVFSVGDLGLKRAIQKLYALESEPDEKYLRELSSKWSPYRTHASRILWRSLDNEPLTKK